MRNIYEKALAALPASDIDHHETDLYLRKTPASEALIREYEFAANVTIFHDNIDGDIWYDIPFAYTPTWEAHCKG